MPSLFMADTKEAEVNDFLQKISKKNEALKTMVETTVDDSLNHVVALAKKLWDDLTEKNKSIDKLEKDVEDLKALVKKKN